MAHLMLGLAVIATLGMTLAGREVLAGGRWPAGLVRGLMALGWVLGAAVVVRRLTIAMGFFV